MKRKFLIMLLIGSMLTGVTACSKKTNDNENSVNNEQDIEESSNNQQQNTESEEDEKINLSELSAEEIINLYLQAGYPISKVIVYTEENDKNNLLGRPKQYISKVNFADNRCEQLDIEDSPTGGTIEVFNNNEDAQARKEYVEKIINSSSMFLQYVYLKDNVLIRIDKELTPTQAKEYENGLNLMSLGKKPEFIEENSEAETDN